MRKYLLCLVISTLLLFSQTLHAQTTYVENFDATVIGALPNDWVVSSNTKVGEYITPLNNCNINKGLPTPGVGSSAPVKILLPSQTFSTSQPNISATFGIYVFDATMKCNSMKDFPCATFVKAYLVKSSYTNINGDPTAAEIYAQQPDYQIVNANGLNTVVLPNPSITNGASYRLLLDFKTAGGNCQSGNTKFVFDDFRVISNNCSAAGCVPTANDDYFYSELQNFNQTVSGNVFGGFAPWTTAVNATYKLPSLNIFPAVNAGLDKDDNNTPLSTMTFSLVSGPVVEGSKGCPTPTPNPGTLTFNSNGTFTYVNSNACITQISFTYKIKNGALESRVAKVTISFNQPAVPLPVKLKSFNAKRNKEKVLLTWETAMEANNSGFDVQRKVGGEDWKTIAFVFSKADGGNSSALLNYEYPDVNTAKVVTQYRLRQVDIDTRYTLSEIRSVGGEAQAAQLLVYPNPSTDGKVNVVFDARNATHNVSVSDMTGREIKQYRNITSGSLQIDGLKDGIYTLHITDVNTAETAIQKVIVKKR